MILLAFASLGFLVGNLVGLSAESTLGLVLPLLFAFGGGSAVAFLHKLPPEDRRLAGAAVAALSLSCLVGTYSGILVSEYELLSPNRVERAEKIDVETASEEPGTTVQGSIESRKYLRSADVGLIDIIDQRYKGGELSAAGAYEAVYEIVSEAAVR